MAERERKWFTHGYADDHTDNCSYFSGFSSAHHLSAFGHSGRRHISDRVGAAAEKTARQRTDQDHTEAVADMSDYCVCHGASDPGLFSREPGSRTGVDLIPLSTWGTSAQAHAYFIENILMFIPFGILLPFRVPALRRALFCIDAGFLCSLLLETAQLLTGRGYCQLDDIATNTLGTGLGYLIYRLWQRYGRKR